MICRKIVLVAKKMLENSMNKDIEDDNLFVSKLIILVINALL